MIIKTLNRGESQAAMNTWLDNYPNLPAVEGDYGVIRDDITEFNRQIRMDAEKIPGQRKDYYIDVHMGIRLYSYLWERNGFTMRFAENDDFWRYLSLIVAPHVVAERWSKDNADHYWSKPTRIWFRSIWWYIHLSWQGDTESTLKVLENRHFSTDTILNFVERSGRNGICIEAYRNIIYLYSRISEDELKRYNKEKSSDRDDLFRVVMKLNTAKMLVMDPALFKGGEQAYAMKLFEDVGIIINAAQNY